MLRLILLSISILLFACKEGGQVSKENAIRVGFNPWPGDEVIYLAEHLGYYKEEGVKVKLVEVGSLGDTRSAFEKGSVDIATSTNIDLLQVRCRNKKEAQIIALTDYSNGGDVILAKEEIKTVADLKGKKVGAEGGSLNIYVLFRALEKNGVNLKDVEVVYLDQTSMNDAISTGKVDAVVTYPPYSIEISNKHKVNKLFTSKEIPAEVLDVLIADKSFVENNQENLTKFFKAIDRAWDYMNKNKDKAYAVMAAREKVSVEEFKTAIEEDLQLVRFKDQTELFKTGGSIDQAMQKTYEIMKLTGNLKGEPGDTPYVNSSIVNKFKK